MDVEDDVVARNSSLLEEMSEPARRRARGSPGKARLRLPPSSGEQRFAAITAGDVGHRQDGDQPAMRSGSSRRISRASDSSPSYSSP